MRPGVQLFLSVALVACGEAGVGEEQPRAPTVSELRIEPNPKNTLSCFVSWRTDVPATSAVEFGADRLEFVIASRSRVKQHRVLVIGMRADTEYRLRARSENDLGADVAQGRFSTEPWPAHFPAVELVQRDERRSQRGWTLTNAHTLRHNDQNASGRPELILMVDEQGAPVWYFEHGPSASPRGDVSADFLPNGNVLVGATATEPPREVDMAGKVVWEGPSRDGTPRGPITHHTGKLANGNYLVQRDFGTVAGGVLYEELTPENDVVWSWNLFDFVQPPPRAEGLDWCHGNSITVDEDDDAVYVNCRFLGVFKTTRQDPELLWHFGGRHDADLRGDVDVVPEAARFTDAHDPEIHDDGTLLLYDNGGYYRDLPSGETAPLRSRVVEYRIDDERKRAELVWEFPGDFEVDPWFRDDWHTQIFGDANRLPNGNVLITAGTGASGEQTRIFEVTRDDGRVVWELRMPERTSSYRAQRAWPPPLVRSLD